MLPWVREIDPLAEQSGFAGVVAVDRGGEIEFAKAYGLADRAHQIPNTLDTRFGRAPDHRLRPHGAAHDLAGTERYLAVLGGHPAKLRAGERFCYCNSGYVVLALIAERVSGVPFPQLVQDRVCRPAGMGDTGLMRSDELPGQAAVGYLPIEGISRTNVFHLPVVGSGDGGIYSTTADISALWRSLFANTIAPARWVAQMVRPRSDVLAQSMRYGLGFWLGRRTSTVILEGLDAGMSFRSLHDPRSTVTRTVISNSSDGAWPVTRRLDDLLAG